MYTSADLQVAVTHGCVKVYIFAAAACVILLRFAAESRKSHCNGSVRRVKGALGTDFLWILAPMIFLLKLFLKRASTSLFFRFGVEIRFWSCKFAAICGAVVRSSIVFCNSVSADRSGMAASRLLLAAAACVILLRFAAESRKSHCNGSVRRVKGALGTDFLWILAPMIFLLKFLLKNRSKSTFFGSGVEIRFWSCNFWCRCA